MSEDFIQQCCDKAASFITQEDYDSAEKYLRKALQRQPNHLKVISLLSIVAEGRKKNKNGNILQLCVYCLVEEKSEVRQRRQTQGETNVSYTPVRLFLKIYF